jgi:hypothetical protein
MARKQPGRRYSKNWGGRRPGAGRPPKPDAGAPHLPRPDLDGEHPIHVWWTTRDDVPSLRSPRIVKLIRQSIEAGADRFGCRVAYFGIDRDRLDLICESDDADALSRCLQGLSVRIARGVNSALDRRGKVFNDRYRQRLLADRATMKDALERVATAKRNGEVAKPTTRRLRDGWRRMTS